MSRRLATLLALALLWAGSAAAEERAVLENVRREWQNAYGAILFTVLADVRNVSKTPVEYVQVKVVLVDKHGETVAERSGYNLGAEILEDATSPAARAEKAKQVKAIAPGATDLVRISFDKSDIGKPFRSANVMLVEVH